VADQLGRFVDVNDDPAELLFAVLDLESRLGELDLDGARTTLAARYGPEAVLASLADLYGVVDVKPVTAPPGAQPAARADRSTAATPAASTPARTTSHASRPGGVPEVPRAARPESVTLLSCLGWRRYAIESEGATADAVGLPLAVVTDDDGVRDALPQAKHVASRDFLAGLERPAASPLRGMLARLWRPDRGSTPAAAAWNATHVLTHVSASSWAVALLAADPEAHLVVELDRARLGLDPVDAP
jgi:hypothetical protein